MTDATGPGLSDIPEDKLRHAVERIADLQAVIAAWANSGAITAEPTTRPDLTRIEWNLRVRELPPLRRVSLIFGDVLHALRSALDNMAWELCHLGGAQPLRPKQIYFPIASTQKDWDAKASALETMQADVLARIRSLQPFLLDTPLMSLLYWVHELNLTEKHRTLVQPSYSIVGMETQAGVSVEAGTELHMEADPGPLTIEDGGFAVALQLSRPATSMEPMSVGVQTQFDVTLSDTTVEITLLLEGMKMAVETALSVCRNAAPAGTVGVVFGNARGPE